MPDETMALIQDDTLFDPADVEATPDLQPVPAQQYRVTILSVRMKRQKPSEKNGFADRPYISVQLEIPDEPSAKPIEHFLTFIVRREDIGTVVNSAKGPKTLTESDFQDAQRAWKDFLRAFNVYDPNNMPRFSGAGDNAICAELRGLEGVAYVNLKAGQNGPENGIGKFIVPTEAESE